MLTPDELIMRHAELPYDPAKAHDYYLRTRQLKGRISGKQIVPIRKTVTTVTPLAKPKILPKKSVEQIRTDTEVRVAALQKRLTLLNKVLSELTKQIKLLNGVTTPNKTKKPGNKTQTVQQKNAAAKTAKTYYEKHKNDKLKPSQNAKDLQAKIDAVLEKIKKMRDELALAKAEAKKHAGSVGASNIKTNK